MKFQNIFTIFLLLFSLSFQAQQDTIKIELKALKDVPKEKLQKDDFGNVFYYDEKQKARIYEINGEKVVVMDELLLMQRPHFNNQLDRNFYYFLNKKLNRVYPYFITALEQYRDIQDELSKIDDEKKRAYIRKRQEGLANQYETQLRDLTTTEGRIFAKLMHRATGKTVYEIIKELRGNWSAFWWNVKGNIADVDIKEPYDPHANRQDAFVESLLYSNWNLGYLQPYEGYRDFKIKK
ncbi:DUF4294 domain-containing protein [Cloacibacterium normanense]|uniref:Molecular chaperone DnaJ n=1 Tax=Cloacibacterium normanense TaxID=237258 RepID=A0A1E5UEM9_9FLAO|nr:DUF4294 domain-containing protein [Cloacibacterium normanense]AZI69184.1 DUF4294 domain-containing protein [Cloacibacterium normanense]OEL11383.1 hypothetical protein BHF72_2253 [Cloacibacterium normanense]SDO15016.1 protein of unknown function [Cloacibacterium normanense]